MSQAAHCSGSPHKVARSELIFDPRVADWVAMLIPMQIDFGPCQAIGIASNGRLLAGIVYHDYQPQFGTMQASIASVSPMWARPENIRALLHYPFEQLGVYKLWSSTPLSYTKALKMVKHLGFKREGVLAHHFGHEHCVISRLFKPDYERIYIGATSHRRQILTKATACA